MSARISALTTGKEHCLVHRVGIVVHLASSKVAFASPRHAGRAPHQACMRRMRRSHPAEPIVINSLPLATPSSNWHLHALRVPRNHQVRQQGQGTRNRDPRVTTPSPRAGMALPVKIARWSLCTDSPRLSSACSSRRKLDVAVIVAQEQGTQQLAKLFRRPMNRISSGCAAESLQRDDSADTP